MKTREIVMLIATAMIYGSYINAEDGHDYGEHGHDHVHKHEAAEKIEEKILKVGENVGIIKLSHSTSEGKVTIAVLKIDKTPLVIEKAPRLNLFADGKRKQVKTKAVGDSKSKFEAKGETLKKDLNGKVSIKIGEKSYQVAINAPVDHGHGPGCDHAH